MRNGYPETGTYGMLLHHDNTGPYTAALTLELLKKDMVNLLHHLPYSLDLAPADFFLVLYGKKLLRGRRFMTDEVLTQAFKLTIGDMPHEKWRRCLDNWLKKMKPRISASGMHFEKL